MGVLMALGALSDLYFKFGLRGCPQQQSILILKFSVIQKSALKRSPDWAQAVFFIKEGTRQWLAEVHNHVQGMRFLTVQGSSAAQQKG